MSEQTHPTQFTAANDNAGQSRSAEIALRGLVQLLARAELRRAAEAPANTNAPGTTKTQDQ